MRGGAAHGTEVEVRGETVHEEEGQVRRFAAHGTRGVLHGGPHEEGGEV